MNNTKSFKFPCRNCLVDTNHRLLYEQTIVEETGYHEQDQEQYGETWESRTTYKLIQCCGCDDIRLRISIFEDPLGWENTFETVYPPDQVRHMPDWVIIELRSSGFSLNRPTAKAGRSELLSDIKKFLREIYQALGGGSNRLAMMGIRALTERIMSEEVGDRGTFKSTTEAFFMKGHVAPSQQDLFQTALIEAGHAAMHRNWEPKRSDVFTLLDIIEALIKSLYVDSDKASELAGRIPPKAPKITKKPPSRK